MGKPMTRMANYESQRASMDMVKQSFVPHWRDISNYIQPRRARFFAGDANKGDRRNQNIIDSTGTQASDTLQSGMMSGLTSPSRMWFNIVLPDKDLMKYEPVKDWLYRESNALSGDFNQSNLYQELPSVYGDCGDFGTGCMLIEEDYNHLLRALCIPIGSYMLGLDENLRVGMFFRTFMMTVRQLVRKFGSMTESGQADWSRFSDRVKTAWEDGNYNTSIETYHLIQPNERYDAKRFASKKYESCYWEKGKDDDKFLREAGYSYWPVLAPRWKTTGEDIYGTSCPGMTALGDIKQLQLMQKKKAQAIEKLVDPPMQAPTSMEGKRTSILPGDLNYVDAQGIREGGMRPVHEVRPDLQGIVLDIQDIRQIIGGAYKTRLFRAIMDTDRRDITAREIEELHQEKIGELTPAMERFNPDLLAPLVEIGFGLRLKQGKVSPPPPEIQGMTTLVEFMSIMHQAQKQLGIKGLERTATFALQFASVDPTILHRLNSGGMLKTYAEMNSAPPGIIYSDEEVKNIEDHIAQQAKIQQGLAAAQQVAGVAKDMHSLAGAGAPAAQ